MPGPPVVNDGGRTVRSLGLIFLQLVVLACVFEFVRSPLLWPAVMLSFFLPLLVVVLSGSCGLSLLSIVICFVTQHAPFMAVQEKFGFVMASDAINDLHVAHVLSEQGHFVLGSVGYGERSCTYSYNILLHVLAVMMSRMTGLDLSLVAVYCIPVLEAVLTALLVYLLFDDVSVRLRDKAWLGLGCLIYATNWFYAYKHAQFVREVWAFPLALAILHITWRRLLERNSYRIEKAVVVILLLVAVVLGHHFTSYMLLLLILTMTVASAPALRLQRGLLNVLLLLGCLTFAYATYVTLGVFEQQIAATVESIAGLLKCTVTVESTSIPVLPEYRLWRKVLGISYYVICYALALYGWVRMMRSGLPVWIGGFMALFLMMLPLGAMLRLTAQQEWAYSLSVRSIIWSFLGISVLAAQGLFFLLERVKGFRKTFFVACCFLLLSAGLQAQVEPIFDSDAFEVPITEARYAAAGWLRNVSVPGKSMLVTERKDSPEGFEITRDMAPYAYKREYHLGWLSYRDFAGYIPVVRLRDGRVLFDDMEGASLIYTNGEASWGLKVGDEENGHVYHRTRRGDL